MINLQKQLGYAVCTILPLFFDIFGLQGRSNTVLYDQKKLREYLTQFFAAKVIAVFLQSM